MAALGAVLLPLSVPADSSVILEDVRLERGRQSVPPRRQQIPARAEFVVGAHLLAMTPSELVLLEAGDRGEVWREAPDVGLRWLGTDGTCAFLQAARPWNTPITPAQAQIRRLDVAGKRWLAPLTLPAPKAGEMIVDLHLRKGRAVVLSHLFAGNGEQHLASYRVTGFDLDSARVLWSQTFAARPGAPGPPAVLLSAASRPAEVPAGLSLLTGLGEHVLVAAGGEQDLLCLNISSGATVWRLERLWEFQRGFIGPSVWRHFLSRFGEEEPFGNEKKAYEAKLGRLRKVFEAQWRGSMVGGPVVVRASDEEDGDERFSVFVTVARSAAQGERSNWSAALSDCTVYEIRDDGRVGSMTQLPRFPVSAAAAVDRGEAVWLCEQDTLLRLGTTSPDADRGMGPGGRDMIGRVRWLRELTPTETRPAGSPRPWLRTEPAGSFPAFGPKHLWLIQEGGRVETPTTKAMSFPISRVSLATGETELLVLRVPLTAVVPPPESNYRGGDDDFFTYGPYHLAITHLREQEGRLLITLGQKEWSAELEFEIPAGAAEAAAEK